MEHFGLAAEKIPESHEKAPDYLIKDGDRRYLIELKTKYDSPEFLEQRERELEDSGIYEHQSVLKRSNAMSGIVGDAYKQLIDSKKRHHADECYLFLLASEPYANDKYEQFYNTLYGQKFIIPLGNNNVPPPRYCFYYSFSDFYRYRDIIDGAIVSNGSSLKFCLNSFSTAYNSADGNLFAKRFPKVVDPIQQEKEGVAYLMDSDIDRRNIDELNAYLQNKYDLEKVTQADFPSIIVESRGKLT